jgi:hypothetical protein
MRDQQLQFCCPWAFMLTAALHRACRLPPLQDGKLLFLVVWGAFNGGCCAPGILLLALLHQPP